jgi:hypothetical protein
MIDTLEVSLMMKEILTELVHVSSNDMSGFLEEQIIEPIRARGLISRQIEDDLINFLSGEGEAQKLKIGVALD